jgi:hypothetical protein
MREAARLFRARSDFPLEHVATLSMIPGVSWSDHRSFWREGYRAFMATDTAFCRYAHYHTAQDTPVKLAYLALTCATEDSSAASSRSRRRQDRRAARGAARTGAAGDRLKIRFLAFCTGTPNRRLILRRPARRSARRAEAVVRDPESTSKRTWSEHAVISGFGPKRTSAGPNPGPATSVACSSSHAACRPLFQIALKKILQMTKRSLLVRPSVRRQITPLPPSTLKLRRERYS